MDKNQIKGEWDSIKGKIKETWGKLTNEDLTQINGKKDQLIAKLEKAYGITKEKAQEQIKNFESKFKG